MPHEVVDGWSERRKTDSPARNEDILALELSNWPGAAERTSDAQLIACSQAAQGTGHAANESDCVRDDRSVLCVRAYRDSRFTITRDVKHVELPRFEEVGIPHGGIREAQAESGHLWDLLLDLDNFGPLELQWPVGISRARTRLPSVIV
jgi:hypothetical protein